MPHAPIPRRDFLKGSALATVAAVGIYAFPAAPETVRALGAGLAQLSRSYDAVSVGRLSSLQVGEPLDFTYPRLEHANFLVKLGTPAWGGVGPDGDVVAFSYLCSHMGCPLNGTYHQEHAMLGPCPCHYSRFDLAKGGQLILGQATQSLPQIWLKLDGDELYAVGVSGIVYGFAGNLTGGSVLS